MTTINGINIDQLEDTVGSVKENPEIANFRFRAKNKWIKGGHNRTTIESFYGACKEQKHPKPFTHEEDEPVILLGEDKGANPVEYLLTALAGCLTTSLVFHAAARGITVNSVESELEGDLDLHGFLGLSEKVRNGYQEIRVNMHVEADTDQETINTLIELAQKRSPVFDMVTNPVPVKVTGIII